MGWMVTDPGPSGKRCGAIRRLGDLRIAPRQVPDTAGPRSAVEWVMISLRDRLQTWLTTRSCDSNPGRSVPPPEAAAHEDLGYVLRSWPDLPQELKTARVYRTLSIISTGQCNRWRLLALTKMKEHELDALLGCLVRGGWVESLAKPSSPPRGDQ